MRPNFQTPVLPTHTGGTITRALESQMCPRSQLHLFDARNMVSRIKAIKRFIANHLFLQYRTGTEILFSAQSLALETNRLHTHDSMSTMWSLR